MSEGNESPQNGTLNSRHIRHSAETQSQTVGNDVEGAVFQTFPPWDLGTFCWDAQVS